VAARHDFDPETAQRDVPGRLRDEATLNDIHPGQEVRCCLRRNRAHHRRGSVRGVAPGEHRPGLPVGARCRRRGDIGCR
jgi:hypothetical protein